ncbi:MAG: hypothetical protein O3C67_00090 [Cyanobacteria bacterium]|nr:hypothetical protein [Cyanobacteriota bacterium]
MGDFLQAIQNTPIPTILIVVGLFILVLGFVTKIGGIIEVSSEQKKWTIPVGLFVLCIGLVLYLHSGSPSGTVTSTPEPTPTQTAMPITASVDRSPPVGINSEQWEKCRSVQQILPVAEAGPGAANKQINAEGLVRMPPSDQSGIWTDLKCPQIPEIYDW